MDIWVKNAHQLFNINRKEVINDRSRPATGKNGLPALPVCPSTVSYPGNRRIPLFCLPE